MVRPLDWQRDGPQWPHHEHSRFVQAGGLHWHVQRFDGPDAAAPWALLLHGTGASTHSWRALAPLLATHFNLITLDLPGHAFTGLPPGGAGAPQLSLPGMARAVHGLLQKLGCTPALVVGHSAGAAVALRMALDGLIHPRLLVGLNAALLPLGGLAGQLFAPAAKLMASAPFVPRLFAWHAQTPAALQRLLDSTGSTLDREGTELYRRLVASPDHAAGALGMMANWDLDSFARDLPRLAVPLLLIVGDQDRTVPPAQSEQVLQRLSPAAQARCTHLPGLGHLAHEEQPALVAGHIVKAYEDAQVVTT
ncbi:MAG: alpha/beta fold hydrolase BchO [Hydrogenophaga sp.]|uniref:alpha/beta fold hydrolase BchO n=1 Tax=Hydrogenophaga sp. TaxID=1904254 RepID=UPI003D9BA45E